MHHFGFPRHPALTLAVSLTLATGVLGCLPVFSGQSHGRSEVETRATKSPLNQGLSGLKVGAGLGFEPRTFRL